MEPKESLIATLLEIRDNLRMILSQTENFTRKLVGPRPSDPKSSSPTEECVASIVVDIRVLTFNVQEAIGTHHNFIGTFPGHDADCAAAPRGFRA